MSKKIYLILLVLTSLFLLTACEMGGGDTKKLSYKNNGYTVSFNVPKDKNYELKENTYDNMYIYYSLKGDKVSLYLTEMRIPNGWEEWKNKVIDGKLSSIINPEEISIGNYEAIKYDYYDENGEFKGYVYEVNIDFIKSKQSIHMVILPGNDETKNISEVLADKEVEDIINSINIK